VNDRRRRPLADTFLPLSPAVFEILLSLSDEDRHGYAIMRDVERRSGGGTRLRPGTLYRAVARLVDDELIEELDARPAAEADDERRRYYRLTDLGRRVAEAEARRLSSLLREARAKKVLRGADT
jgi:DNA-binding PadR family transcriptional regulator